MNENRTLLCGGDDENGDSTRAIKLDSFVFRCVVAASLEVADPFQFGAAAAKLRPELDRCADAMQFAKLNETELPADVTPDRTSALLSCLEVVGRQVEKELFMFV